MKKQPRPYQAAAKRSAYAELRKHRSTLVVMATGLGKTVTFAEMVGDCVRKGKRALVLAHRGNLIDQAAAKISAFEGLSVAFEQADRRQALEPCMDGIDGFAPVVVATVQSMARRLESFERDHFGLIVIDEAHHAPAGQYQSCIEHFSAAKILGVTATPDRADAVALGGTFDSVAYQYDLYDGIQDGWLVPISQHTVQCENLDLSKVRSTAGDLNQGDLESLLTEIDLLQEIAGPTVELCRDRQAIVFAATVKHAHLLAEAIRQQLADAGCEGGVQAIDGSANAEQREAVLSSYSRGETQFLVNCALYTEGFDAPSTGAVVLGRMTKSRALLAQMVGRGTRTLPGCLDGLATAPDRIAAIEASAKPNCLVLDFAGNAGKHSLAGVVDALGGDISEPEEKITRSILERGIETDVMEAVRAAREQIQAMERAKMREQARKGYKTASINPFVILGASAREDTFGRQPTERQVAVLDRWGITVTPEMDRMQCSSLIQACIDRRNADLCTFKQANALIRAGVDAAVTDRMPFTVASKLLTELQKNRYRTPESWRDTYLDAKRH